MRYNYLKTRIGRRFLLVFLIVSLLPLLIMRWLAIRKSEAAIKQQTVATLRAASDGAEAQIREFLGDLKEHLLQLSQDPRIRAALENEIDSEGGAAGGASIAGDGDKLSKLFTSWRQTTPELEEIQVLTPKGRLFASSAGEREGSDFSSTKYFKQGREKYFVGDVFADPVSGLPTWMLAMPIKSTKKEELLGVAAFRIDPKSLSELTSGRRVLAEGADTQSFRTGETGETYIVNEDFLMITESRFTPNAVLKVKVNTKPVRVGFEQGHEITGEYKDYRGVLVSGASFVLREPRWVVITEVDFSQSFAALLKLRDELIIAATILVFVAILIAWSITWRVIKPITLLAEADRAMAERDERKSLVPESGLPNDEIGKMIRQRNERVKSVFDYQRLLEERTTKLQEMVNEIEHISYAIVHDMRAPLRAMQGFASLLQSDEEELSPAERSAYLGNISTAAVRLDQLIRDVLTYNQTVLRRASLNPVELGPLLLGMINTYPNLSPDKAEVEVQGEIPTVIGNEALLTQCFSNLLDNAVKFVEAGTKPRIRIWAEVLSGTIDPIAEAKSLPNLFVASTKEFKGEGANVEDLRSKTPFVRIWVEDNGTGIPKEAQPRLFRMFQRLTNDHQGTGIGLAIVHKVVERMGGHVGVISEPGEGSRFWIDLQAYVSGSERKAETG